MPGTNVVAVKRELCERLRASSAPALVGVAIVYSEATQKTLPRERITFGEPRFVHSQSAAANGTRVPRTEQATIECWVHVRMQGRPPEQCDARAVEIGAVLEEYLADHPTLDGAIPALEMVRVADGDIGHVIDAEGTWSQITYRIAAVSRYIR